MIFYFSGTGNSRWAATQLNRATHDKMVNIAELMRQSPEDKQLKPFTLQKGERLGFVFPVHGWRVPRLVRQFLEKYLQISSEDGKRPFVYTVCTAGDDIGLTIEVLHHSLAKNSTLQALGIQQVDAAYSLIMPESYVGLPFMDVDTKEDEQRKKEQAAKDLQTICQEIFERKTGICRTFKGSMPWLKTKVIGGFFELFLITDKHFHVQKEQCVKCGICANVCPVINIDGGQGKIPQWLHHDNCPTCFACYHHCPHHAIEFGRQTQKKGQYYFRLLAILLVLSSFLTVYAVKVSPRPLSVLQKDGTYLTVYAHGDEHFHWYTTADGSLLIHEDNTFSLASQAEIETFQARQKEYLEQQAQIQTFPLTRSTSTGKISLGTATPNYFPHKGTPKALVILVEFQDSTFKAKDPKAVFDYYLNGTASSAIPEDFSTTMVNNNYGSVAQYFQDMSEGQFRPQFDVVGPVKVSMVEGFYGKNFGSTNDLYYGSMIREACALVDDEVDFTQYDADGDGYADLVYIIYAGYSESYTGNSSSCLWPKSSTGSYGTYDGIKVSRHGINNELNDTPLQQPSDGRFSLNGIGLFCHEFSHTMGLPDLYPTSNWSGQQGLEYWDLMDSGEYSNNGYTPTPYTPWELELMGWKETLTLDSTARQMTLPPYDNDRKAYKIEGEDGEYIILQNIQNTGWWSGMMGHGMLVYRVDYPYSSVNLNDAPNNNVLRPAVTIVPADGKLISYYDDSYSREEYEQSHYGDPFPGTCQVTSLQSVTLNRSTLVRPIYNIKESGDGTITFDYLQDFSSTDISHTLWDVPGSQKDQQNIYSLDGRFLGTDASILKPGIYIIGKRKMRVK